MAQAAASWSNAGTAPRTARDIVADVTLLTLDVLQRTIFSDGLGGDPEQVRGAMRSYFEIIGRIEPLDLWACPTSCLGSAVSKHALRCSSSIVPSIPLIAARRRHLARDPAGVPMTSSPHAQGPRPRDRAGDERSRGQSQYHYLHCRQPRNHGQHHQLVAVSFVAIAILARVLAEAEREIGGPAQGLADLAERLVDTRALAAISRAAIAADDLMGCGIKPGSMVVIAPYGLHHHRLLWERPDEFDPRRFLGEVRDRIDRFAYLPFAVDRGFASVRASRCKRRRRRGDRDEALRARAGAGPGGCGRSSE